MKKYLLAFTLLSTLGSAAAFADDNDRVRVVDHRDDATDRSSSWSSLAQRRLTSAKGSITFQLRNDGADRLRLAIAGGSARIKKVTITYADGDRSVMNVNELLSGSETSALQTPPRSGAIESITVTYAKATGRRVALSLQGMDRADRNDRDDRSDRDDDRRHRSDRDDDRRDRDRDDRRDDSPRR